MKKVLLIIAFTLSIGKALAFSTYVIRNQGEQETLDTIVAKFTPQYELLKGNRNLTYRKYLKAWNPHVSNWKKIPTGTKIFIESPTLPLSAGEVPPDYFSVTQYIPQQMLENPKVSFFYTASMGNFQEKLNNELGDQISSTQNSPFTLGVSGTVDFSGKENYLSGSMYWSKLTATLVSGDANASSLSVPSEYGLNTYYNHPFVYNDVSFSSYGGVDFESFPTYNTLQYINRADLGFNQNRIFYGTIGIEQVGYWKLRQINFKLSYAKSLLSGTSSPDTIDRFSGYRILFFTNFKYSDRYSFHFLYKLHQLTGPTNLTINRFGIGVSMPIF